jgi:hypothetical protein
MCPFGQASVNRGRDHGLARQRAVDKSVQIEHCASMLDFANGPTMCDFRHRYSLELLGYLMIDRKIHRAK